MNVQNLLQYAPLLGALGVASLIGNWFGGGRSRREVRSAVLKALRETESQRWATEPDHVGFRDFITAVHDLETAALIARIPRKAVHHYVVLAHAARGLSEDAVDYFPDLKGYSGPINGYFNTLVRDAAGVLTGLAWHPWWSRIVLLRSLRNLRNRALEFKDEEVRWALATAQKQHNPLPGPLGEIEGVEDPPQIVEPSGKPDR
ncbi:hypothetical protein PXH78_26895 [Mycolicibacterium smegmatis]|uniref:hypothetical protein n=1 Tax=Mycolicibacterium smegmatis TaxID=1772 RepID=UPI0005D75E51|nr:hypothetical protein [Mycolicibacterium smegmatis]MDF1902740.1 hypothetical protein [Mycolicibacterium smegmatis]MDF1909016.1 hypothetical protein [Mycolicibacterium smegmatis]MDF1921235.1 hypothetical protein [Mycolicibacterium smegmatis]MDF1927500.1 hypothetical protein [Mycolicibacterium smegmatis]UAK53357.1 hypothetical protein K8P01_22455 [Mycolicibacterium smegmatis]